ncbi:MAG: heme NO-binding domain-containing protein [Cyclobacteriaceae bacterium]|nr:heme NO-binding domain-containing protein [Cyclobacteriaceae bacterium]
MHGLIFNQLQQFVTRTHGPVVWEEIELAAGKDLPMFMPTKVYDDAHFFGMLQAAEKTLKVSGEDIMHSFGEYLAPQLVKIYAQTIKPEWSVIDLLEHTENTMHRAVRFADKQADPPKLRCKRIDTNSVEILYNSSRGMVAFGRGLIVGFSKAFSQPLEIQQVTQNDGTLLRIKMLKS